MEIHVTLKMGCFGSVLFHAPKEKRCQQCPLIADCANDVALNRDRLSDLVAKLGGVRSKTRKLRDALVEGRQPETELRVSTSEPLMEEQSPGISRLALNKKPAELLARWRKHGINLAKIKQGINPFLTGDSQFARIGVQWLLDNFASHRMVTKNDLVMAFMDQLPWTKGTANSHAGILLDILAYEGLIEMEGSRIRGVW